MSADIHISGDDELIITFQGPAIQALQEWSHRTGLPVKTILQEAMGVYKSALDAASRGDVVLVADASRRPHAEIRTRAMKIVRDLLPIN